MGTRISMAPSNLVFIGGIPPEATEADVRKEIELVGKVLKISYRPVYETVGWAFVAYATVKEAERARQLLSGKVMGGFNTTRALETKMGEGLFGAAVVEETMKEAVSRWTEHTTPEGHTYYQNVVTKAVTWLKPEDTRPAPAFVPPASMPALGLLPSSVPAPTPAVPAPVTSTSLVAPVANAIANAQGMLNRSSIGPMGANLFVYNIPATWDENIFSQHFTHFGTIVSCRVQRDNEQRPRGYGFISFDDSKAAAAAIAGMNGFMVEGKSLKVSLKKGDETALSNPASLGLAPVPGISPPAAVEAAATPGENSDVSSIFETMRVRGTTPGKASGKGPYT